MPALMAPVEKPRKQPVQSRSTATVDAILEATIQVLVAVGKEKLTTLAGVNLDGHLTCNTTTTLPPPPACWHVGRVCWPGSR